MTTYAWVGRTRNGQTIKGERAAESPEALTDSLRKEQRFKRINDKSLAVFTRQFSVMIDAGLPLVQCLELLSKEEPDKRLAAAIDQVRVDVEAGSTLAGRQTATGRRPRRNGVLGKAERHVVDGDRSQCRDRQSWSAEEHQRCRQGGAVSEMGARPLRITPAQFPERRSDVFDV